MSNYYSWGCQNNEWIIKFNFNQGSLNEFNLWFLFHIYVEQDQRLK